MKRSIFILLIFLFNLTSAQENILFWPKGEMPNSKGLKIEKQASNPEISTQEAELFVFLPPKAERSKRSVIIIPGGGYSKLTYNEGAFQIAKWMNTLGISAFVLYYRLPTSPDLVQREIAPLQDAQAAIKYVRINASQWNLSPDQVGVVGTSAGGHLATSVSNIAIDYTGLKGDWSNISTIPDFAVLFCPVIDFGTFAHAGSRKSLLGETASQEKITEYSMQNRVTEKTPPTILFHNQDDTAVPAMNSILYFKAMTKNKVKGALFVFPEGGHRFSITNKNELSENWKKLCADWLKTLDSK
ncbi:alpha/beta hydrolase [Epilithonimonas ginsengisoli]|uniref:Alpha/beta hydrolase n=1 Tax=Epilithonimonas ginsengisoli TaxID=1245592 RepID=A0ABU4JFD5_9FLAO|nr:MULTISPECIES: alpha/beta hydrolase [Chryseobacterium group]MBV6879695.1 alpha/beta hydrolase [Epilithonimonas sp. FP105]MDW8548334.1 alpha/beta hydrolase [Epilithonimonas ginsengisoli]OAH72567.1 hypothetical protein AXA65_10100 [Chryseobacterium sp. FP211-J200]